MRLAKSLLIVAALVLASGVLFGQGDRGTVTGTVSDSSNAVVPGAKVLVRNTETGTVAETNTTDTGNYTLTGLPAGVYDFSVEAAGFKKSDRSGIQVQVAQTLRVDVALEIGATSESIVVTGESPILRTENAEQSVNVSGEKFNKLPLSIGMSNGGAGSVRNWLAFIVLSPGVNGTSQTASVNGLPTNMFRILIEGQDVSSQNQPDWLSTVAASSVEAIGEFSVQTSNFQAQYQGGLGAIYNFTAKSGTNQIRGSAYDYFTNETVFNAHRFFAADRPRDRDRKTDAGFTFGGPVYIPKLYNGRNKTFFFVNLEVFRNTRMTYGQRGTVPTADFRKGDFSKILTGRVLANDPRGSAILENLIYDPKSDTVINGRTYREPLANNIVPMSYQDPVALKIQDLFPTADNSELINNWTYDLPTLTEQNLPSVKIDHNIDSFRRISFYWAYQSTRDIPGQDPLPDPITQRRDKKAVSNTYRLNYDYSVTPTLFLHMGVGYRRFNNPDSSGAGVLDYDAVKNLGLKGSIKDPSGFPRLTGLSSGTYGGMGFSMGPSNAYNYYDDMLTATADMSYARGSHTYKIGAQMSQSMFSAANRGGSTGNYGFSSTQTSSPGNQGISLPSGTSTGFAYASFLMGLTNSASVNAIWAPQWRKQTWGLYIQDNWKISRKLTLDYGLRWDLQPTGHEIHWRNSMFGPTIPNPSAAGTPGALLFEGYGEGRCNCQFTDTYPFAVSPRLGIAYQLDDKTVLRAGWGFNYGPGPNWQYVTNGNVYGLGADTFSMPTPGNNLPSSYLKDGLVYDAAKLYTATLDPGLGLTPGTVTSSIGRQFDRNGGRPQRVNQWNIAVQRELIKNLSLEVAYVGNRGVWLEADQLTQLNLITPERLASFGLNINNADDRLLLTRNLSDSTVKARGFGVPYTGYPTNRTLAQALRPFPQFTSSLAPTWAPIGNSWYDSMQSKLNKRFSHGFDMTAAFTWSKALALGNGSSLGGAGQSLGGGINDQFNRPNQKSLANNNRPLILTISFNYETPRVSSIKALRAVTGDWHFGGILSYRSGNMLSVPSSSTSNMSAYTFQSTRYNVVSHSFFTIDPGCHCIDPNKDTALINPGAFEEVAQGQWGFSAPYYNDYRWVRLADEQISMARAFPFGESGRMKLFLRIEMFNAFNRVTLSSPSSGNPAQTPTFDSTGRQTGGFGFINVVNGLSGSRSGQGVLRFEF